MARTVKDRPFRIRWVEELAKGNVHHNHDLLGKTFYRLEHFSQTFFKHETQEIRALEAYLRDQEIEYRKEEVEPSPIYDDYSFRPIGWIPRKVEFFWSIKHVARDYSAYCTDFEHYDAENDIDTRDGKEPACSPIITQYRTTCSCCEPIDRRASRNAATMSLQDIAKSYNSGLDIEELAAGYDHLLYDNIQ